MDASSIRFFQKPGLLIFLICATTVVIWLGFRNPSGSSNKRQTQSSLPLENLKERDFRTISLPASDYVGSTSCAECHAEIAEAYRHHPMANSMWKASVASELEDYRDDTSFSPDAQHIYSVERTDQGISHREQLLSADGEELFSQTETITYSVGSGAQGRSYLIEKDGLLLMSPISWYSGLQKWGLSPGYHLPHHKRFSRRVREACLDCHAGRLNTPRGQDDRFESPPFHELSIGCERCHGPAKAHIEYHRSTAETGLSDPIINPAKLDSLRREDVCSQCHLQGEGRIPLYGHEVGDYRPGQRLYETCLIIVKDNQISSGKSSPAVSHVEQMRSSACFSESNGQLGCISCHDPHAVPAEREKVRYYRERCLNCHETQKCSLPVHDRIERRPDNSCIACHMPSIGTSDVPHAANSDHRILRHPESTGMESAASSNSFIIFGSDEMPLEKHALDRALGIWMAQRAMDSKDYNMASRSVILLTAVVKLMPFDADVQEALGLASSILEREEPAITYFRESLELEPERELSLLMLATILDNSGRSQEALPYLKRYLQLNSSDAANWHRYSIILEKDGERERAITAAKKAIELDPSIPIYYQWISHLLALEGASTEAKQFSDKAQSILHAVGAKNTEQQ